MAMSSSTPPHFNGAAILLDRDGVINHDPGDYTKSLAEFHILPTALEAMKAWYDAGFKLIIITNQGGIAKGKYTHDAVAEIHSHLRLEAASKGAPIADIFYSPSCMLCFPLFVHCSFFCALPHLALFRVCVIAFGGLGYLSFSCVMHEQGQAQLFSSNDSSIPLM